MSDYPTQLDICDGKYTVIIDMQTGQAECLRYGEKWRDLTGDKMVLALFDTIVDLQGELDVSKAAHTQTAAWHMGAMQDRQMLMELVEDFLDQVPTDWEIAERASDMLEGMKP